MFGRVTTGASDDLRRVTEISRSMIEEYGMGSKLLARDDGTSSARCPRRPAPSATRSSRC